jgi:hypothetical protein
MVGVLIATPGVPCVTINRRKAIGIPIPFRLLAMIQPSLENLTVTKESRPSLFRIRFLVSTIHDDSASCCRDNSAGYSRGVIDKS